MRLGSLFVQKRSWGGEYSQLSYTHRGKGRTEYVPEKKRAEVELRIANYRMLRELAYRNCRMSITTTL